MMPANEILKRTRIALDVPTDFPERALGLPVGQLARIEDGSEPLETALLDELATLYGVSAADVSVGILAEDDLAQVGVLLRASPGQLPPGLRLEIARIAEARAQLLVLEDTLRWPNRYRELRRHFRHEGVYGQLKEEWRAGRELALALREHLGLAPAAAIPSLRDVVEGLGVELVSTQLADSLVAGFSLADDKHGPAIVVNERGPNSNPWVRRFTVAHELCHVLHDERIHEPSVQRYDEEPSGPEARANAFAATFLSPDDGVHEIMQSMPKASLGDRADALMKRFGINFMTARYRLVHVGKVPKHQVEAIVGVASKPPRGDSWWAAEATWHGEFFPCPTIPRERRGRFARAVVEAWDRAILDRRQALELLRAAPDEPLEALRDALLERRPV